MDDDDAAPDPAAAQTMVTNKPAELDEKLDSAKSSDLSFLHDVLGLAPSDSEDALEHRLQLEARQLDLTINLEALRLGTLPVHQQSTQTISTTGTAARSNSVDSRSTALTSLPSNISVDERTPSFPSLRSRSSRIDRDNNGAAVRRRYRPSENAPLSLPLQNSSFISLSSQTPSFFSLPIIHLSTPSSGPRPSLSKKNSLRFRSLSKLRFGRSEHRLGYMEGCPHCVGETVKQRRVVYTLPCGHRLCTEALRNTVTSVTMQRDPPALPACCGLPVPEKLIEQILTKEERSSLLERLEYWDDFAIATSAQPALTSMKLVGPSHRQPMDIPANDPLAPRVRWDLQWARDRSDFKALYEAQFALRARFLAWSSKRHTELKEQHSQLREALRHQHAIDAEALESQHASSLAEAEDKQVQAEAKMRDAHAKESRDSATAFRHLEAYVSGHYSTGEAHNRDVTDAARAEYVKALHNRESMPQRHESAINVLRGEQSRRMRLRIQRQEEEARKLRRTQMADESELERLCIAALVELNEEIAQRAARARRRWEMTVAIFARRLAGGSNIEGVAAQANISTDNKLIIEKEQSMKRENESSAPEVISQGNAVIGEVI